jgi:hypothetical protein
MWLYYFISFMLGTIVGVGMMALMIANREPEKHEIRAYVGEDGKVDMLVIPRGDIITYHTKEDKADGESEKQDDGAEAAGKEED